MNELLKIAREAIQTQLDHEEYRPKFSAELRDMGASFVTLSKNSELRGCIGSLEAHRPLGDDIIYNARAAAFMDPRFMPLQKDELKDVIIEVSILTVPREISYNSIDDLKSKIKVGVHGVILSYGNRRATFLPQVWEQLQSFEEFFSHLCQKATLPMACLESQPKIEVYEVKKVME